MADDWEDWENDDFTPQLPAAPAVPSTAVADDVEESKFAGEDEEEEEKPKYNVPKPQQVSTAAVCLSSDRRLWYGYGCNCLGVCSPSQARKKPMRTRTRRLE